MREIIRALVVDGKGIAEVATIIIDTIIIMVVDGNGNCEVIETKTATIIPY